MRFSANDGRVSQAVYDDLAESPNRLNPNKVLQRENLGAKDQGQENAYRWENYELFKKNLAEAFEQFDVNNDKALSREEFKKFIVARDQFAKEKKDLEMLD